MSERKPINRIRNSSALQFWNRERHRSLFEAQADNNPIPKESELFNLL